MVDIGSGTNAVINAAGQGQQQANIQGQYARADKQQMLGQVSSAIGRVKQDSKAAKELAALNGVADLAGVPEDSPARGDKAALMEQIRQSYAEKNAQQQADLRMKAEELVQGHINRREGLVPSTGTPSGSTAPSMSPVGTSGMGAPGAMGAPSPVMPRPVFAGGPSTGTSPLTAPAMPTRQPPVTPTAQVPVSWQYDPAQDPNVGRTRATLAARAETEQKAIDEARAFEKAQREGVAAETSGILSDARVSAGRGIGPYGTPTDEDVTSAVASKPRDPRAVAAAQAMVGSKPKFKDTQEGQKFDTDERIREWNATQGTIPRKETKPEPDVEEYARRRGVKPFQGMTKEMVDSLVEKPTTSRGAFLDRRDATARELMLLGGRREQDDFIALSERKKANARDPGSVKDLDDDEEKRLQGYYDKMSAGSEKPVLKAPPVKGKEPDADESGGPPDGDADDAPDAGAEPDADDLKFAKENGLVWDTETKTFIQAVAK